MGIKALVIDLDGSVYHGNSLIERADEAVNLLSESYEVVFLTNNSTRSREGVVEKLLNFGISCKKQQIITSGYAAARYIQARHESSRVYVIGAQGLKDELVEHNITLCEDDCTCVLVGLDKAFTYTKLHNALTFILRGAVFIATNTDPFLITGDGIKPGAGSLVAALETASGKKPIVTGKPSAFITDLIVTHLNVKPHEILIVGDNLRTDILMGIKGGMRTALVLTGASTLNEIGELHIQPDYVFESISELPRRLTEI